MGNGTSFTTSKFSTLLTKAHQELMDFSEKHLNVSIPKETFKVTKLLKERKIKEANEKVDKVIKYQKHRDVCNLIEKDISLLLYRVYSFTEDTYHIPEDLLEAVSSFLFAIPKIQIFTGELLTACQKVCDVVLSRFGTHLARQYLAVLNNCGIKPQIIKKLSEAPSPPNVRIKHLKEIAAKINLDLNLDEASTSTKGTSAVSMAMLASEERVPGETEEDRDASDSIKRKKMKQIVADDQQEATELEDHAATAVELSQFSPHHGSANKSGGRASSSTGPKSKKPEQKQEVKRGEKKQTGNMKKKVVAEVEQEATELAYHAATAPELSQFSPHHGPDNKSGGGSSSPKDPESNIPNQKQKKRNQKEKMKQKVTESEDHAATVVEFSNLSYRSTNVDNSQDQVYCPQNQDFQNSFTPGFQQNQFMQQQQFTSFQAPVPALFQTFASSANDSQGELKALIQQLLLSQQKSAAEINLKVDNMYNDLNSNYGDVCTNVKKLDTQVAQTTEAIKRLQDVLPEKGVENPKNEHVYAIEHRIGRTLELTKSSKKQGGRKRREI